MSFYGLNRKSLRQSHKYLPVQTVNNQPNATFVATISEIWKP